jgi:hypothetical protein
MHWRKSSWALIIWTALMIWGVFSSAWAAAKLCAETTRTYPGDCSGSVLFSVYVVLFIWFVVAVPLWVIRHSAKRKGRICPACGRSVPVSRMRCSCGYSFVP